MLTIEYDMFFAFKCILYKFPMITQFVLTGTFSVAFAFIFQALEGSIPGETKPINFNDAIWVVFIIITTVGFGDIYAVTNLGRLSMIITSLVGIFLVSLIIMSLEKELRLSAYELKAYDLVTRLQAKEDNIALIAKFSNSGLKYVIAKKKYLIMIKQKNSKNISNSKLQSAKNRLKDLLYQKISLRDQLKRNLRIFYNNYEPYNVGENMKKRIKDINEHFATFSKREEMTQQNLQKLLEFLEVIEQVSEFTDNSKIHIENKLIKDNLNIDEVSKRGFDSVHDVSTDFFKPNDKIEVLNNQLPINLLDGYKYTGTTKKSIFSKIPEEEFENNNTLSAKSQFNDFERHLENRSESEYSISEKDLETPMYKYKS